MANTGKYTTTADQIREHAAKLDALLSLEPETRKVYFFEAADAAALLRVDTKTLQRKRDARERALAAGEEPDPLDIASIEFVPPRPTVKYAAQALLDYLLRLSAASDWGRQAASARVAPGSAAALLGFASWLAEAGPYVDWPFSIQPDGRPMDICAAILQDKLTGHAERLTIRGFADRVSDGASRAFAHGEASGLDDPSVTKIPVSKNDQDASGSSDSRL